MAGLMTLLKGTLDKRRAWCDGITPSGRRELAAETEQFVRYAQLGSGILTSAPREASA